MANGVRNGTGGFVRPYDFTDDAANSIAITASRFDEELDGIAAEITNSVAADGQTTMTGALKMGAFKVTNVAAAAALIDAPNAKQISDNAFGYLGNTAGTSAAYTLTPSPAVSAYVTGQEFSFTTNAANTGTTTLTISGLTAKNIKKLNSSGAKVAVAAGDMKSGISYKVRYDGTDMLLTDMALIHIAAASDTVSGIVELATTGETTTGTDTTRVAPISIMKYHEGMIKAWVNFNGTGTVAVRDSYNVSSITDGGVGTYTVNFTNGFSSTNYALVGFVRDFEDVAPGGFLTASSTQGKSTSACAVQSTIGSSVIDTAEINVIFIGDI